MSFLEKIIEFPVYTRENLVSDIGGTVGLFLGLRWVLNYY